PELLTSLTLISPAMPVVKPWQGTDGRLILLLVPGVGRLVARLSDRQPAPTRVKAILELCFADPSLVPPERFDEAVEELERRRTLPWFQTALMASLRGLVLSYL